MSWQQRLSCRACGHAFASYQAAARRESGPLVIRCPNCKSLVDLSRHAVDWCLLADWQKVLRVVTTAISATVTGGGTAILVAVFAYIAAGSLGLIPEKTEPWRYPGAVAAFVVLVIALAVAFFVWWLAYDVKRSRARLRDDQYLRDLVDAGIVTSDRLDRALQTNGLRD